KMSGALRVIWLLVTVVWLAPMATTTPPLMVTGTAGLLLRIRLSWTLTLFTPITATPMPPIVGPPPPEHWASLAVAKLPNTSQLAGLAALDCVFRKKMPAQFPRTALLATVPGPLASRTKMPVLALLLAWLFVTVALAWGESPT